MELAKPLKVQISAKNYIFAAISSDFTTVVLPDEVLTIASISCSGSFVSTSNVSQCYFNFATASSACDTRYAAGLHCEGVTQHDII